MSEQDSGDWNGATEIPMPCSGCTTFTRVALDQLMSQRTFRCAHCGANVVVGDEALFQLQGMKTLMSARH